MKSNFFYIWILILTTALICSCSKDKDDVSTLQGTYIGSNLELSINGIPMKNRVIGINNVGTLILQYIIPGEAVVDIPLTNNNGNLSGETSITNGIISAEGTLNNGKLTIDVTIKISNPIIGTWNLAPLKSNANDVIISSPVFINAEPSSATVSFLDKELTLGELSNMLEGVLSEYAQAIQSITFREDGFAIATFANSTSNSTPIGFIQYYVKDDMIYVMPNLSDIYTSITNETESRA